VDPFWWIVIAIVALAVVSVIVGNVYEQKRTKGWQEIAQKPGLEFLGENNDVLSRYGRMKAFQVGRNHRMKNVVSVDSGEVRIVAGDFRYTTGSGKHKHTHHRTVCVLESSMMNVTHCSLRPERLLWDALGQAFGGQDIDFEEDPQFSKAFVLQGEDETAVRELFDANIRAWFTERAGRNFHFEALGNTLVFHSGKRVAPAQAPELMDQAIQIMKLLANRSA
jgi:hypothetical protein